MIFTPKPKQPLGTGQRTPQRIWQSLIFDSKKYSYYFASCFIMKNVCERGAFPGILPLLLLLGWSKTERGIFTFITFPKSNLRLQAYWSLQLLILKLLLIFTWVKEEFALLILESLFLASAFVTLEANQCNQFYWLFLFSLHTVYNFFFLLVYRSMKSCSKTANVSRQVWGREANNRHQKIYNVSMIISHCHSRLHCTSRRFCNCAD